MKNFFMLLLLGMTGLGLTGCDRDGRMEQRADEIEERGDTMEEVYDDGGRMEQQADDLEERSDELEENLD